MTTGADGSLNAAGDLVMRIIAIEMATRVKVRVDHVGGLRANGRVDFLCGNWDVVRIDGGLVVMRVAIVGVPMGATALRRGLLSVNSGGAEERASESDENWKLHVWKRD
jgi:hypothetical protein